MLNWLFTANLTPYGGYSSIYNNPPLREPTERDTYVEARLHSLEVACAGLWDLLKTKHGYTDQELIESIKAVDQRRGTTGPALGTATQAVCPKCGHKMLTHNHTKCLWCGADVPANPF